jgi:hypothetical protein
MRLLKLNRTFFLILILLIPFIGRSLNIKVYSESQIAIQKIVCFPNFLDTVGNYSLDRIEDNLFEYKGEMTKWIILDVIDIGGNTYRRKIYPNYYNERKLTLVLYIGQSDFYNFDNGAIKPYKPICDQFLVLLHEGENSDSISNKLEKLGLKQCKKGYPVYSFDGDCKERKVIQNKICQIVDGIDLIPLSYRFDGENCRYFSNQVDIILDPDLSLNEVAQLFQSVDIDDFNPIRQYGRLMNYTNCQYYTVYFSSDDMISYEFLKKLKNLYQKNEVLKIFTKNISYQIED